MTGQININFTVFSDSPLYISIADLSDWEYAQNLPSYLSITIPGSKKPKIFSFTKERINNCIYYHLKPCREVFYIGIGNNKR